MTIDHSNAAAVFRQWMRAVYLHSHPDCTLKPHFEVQGVLDYAPERWHILSNEFKLLVFTAEHKPIDAPVVEQIFNVPAKDITKEVKAWIEGLEEL